MVLIPLTLVAGIVALAVILGGPNDPPPMPGIKNPSKNVDYSDMPATSHFAARDGTKLAFRAYPAADGCARGSVVLVHGSSATSRSMHVLAKTFAAAGFNAYAPDVRGHGESGTRGIGFIGQLEDDLEDFLRSEKPLHPNTLAGFSSGGGFVLRFAGSARQKLFENYLLLSPFISQDAPTYRPNSGGWVSIGIPRIIAIALLVAVGVHAFDRLPVTKFAVYEEDKAILTPQYSYALAQNFRPERNYRANIRAVGQPFGLVAGQDDEVFYSDRFAEVFKAEGKDIPIILLPGIGHISLILEQSAVQTAVAAVKSMNEIREFGRHHRK
ncbi:MAG: alpha/beta fold hydrolase [Syntrophales bacterium]|nr:alpha/beta fold hydrolase [Syntrophales bacterium]